MLARTVLMLALASLIAACGGGSGGSMLATSATDPTPPIPTAGANISILFMGNSHTSVNNLSGMVVTMVRASSPGKTVAGAEAPNWMSLEERASDGTSLALLRSQRWSFVVLQAQNYSQSGQFFYPTTGAEALSRMAREGGAVPVMFPEWPRLGVIESQRIYDLHVSIAQKQPACVPPIPQAFDLALAREPSLRLHDSDGNHSAPAGAYLTALVLYATITGLSPTTAPTLTPLAVDSETQARLRGYAAETVQNISARLWCPPMT